MLLISIVPLVFVVLLIQRRRYFAEEELIRNRPNPPPFSGGMQMENTAKVVPHYNSISTVSRLAAINIRAQRKLVLTRTSKSASRRSVRTWTWIWTCHLSLLLVVGLFANCNYSTIYFAPLPHAFPPGKKPHSHRSSVDS